MDLWEDHIQNYPAVQDSRDFSKAVQTAGEILKQDLANFETERILDTLLYSPVDLLTTVSSKYNDDAWSNSVIESFKLLTEVITTHRESVGDHCEHIEKICMLRNQPSDIQRQSLTCLERVARVWGSSRPTQHIDDLERATTCKTQLALLVGTIAEYYPEIIQDDATRIWRVYRKLLESNKKTNTFVQAILQGLCGLFKNFGENLPISELASFYDSMVGYVNTSKCEEVCLTILEKYACLFAERISCDVGIRATVWFKIGERDGASAALRSLYGVIGHENLRDILQREVIPRTRSKGSIKSAALRVLSHVKRRAFDPGDLAVYANVQALEFDLRCGDVSYDTADTISWYIEAQLPDCEKLLQTALLFFENIPVSKRKDILLAMGRSQPDVRSEAVSFLASESCQPLEGSTNNIDKYMDIWRGLLSEDSSLSARYILDDFINHLIFAIEVFLEQDNEELPEKLSSLLTLTSHLLNLPAVEAAKHISVLLPLLGRCCRALPPTAALLSATAAVLRHKNEDSTYPIDCQDIQVDRCRDEAVLCSSCLLLLLIPTTKKNCVDVLKALQIIFSRNDAEANTLILGIKKLEDLLVEYKDQLKREDMDQVIHLVEKTRRRKDLTGKEARILHRDTIMFLGKYGRKSDTSDDSDVNTIISKLKDKLCLKIPNLEERITYKINLQEILHLAINHEDPDALHQLLKIMCVNLSSNRDADITSALLLVSRALCRCHARGSPIDTSGLQRALLFCDEPQHIRQLLTFINDEKSPGVRKMLSDALEALLASRPDDLVRTVAERACVTMKSRDSTSRRAGLDMTEILVTSLKENHALTKELLPSILELIPKTNELDAISPFDITSELFIEKIALFDRETLEGLIENLVIGLTQDGITQNDIKTYKTISKKCLKFIKNIADREGIDYSIITKMCIDICDRDDVEFDKCVLLLSSLKNIIDLPSSSYSSMLHNNNILDGIYNLNIDNNLDVVRLDAILVFLKEYAETLLELNYKRTLEILDNIIRTIPPRSVIYEEKNLLECLSVYKEILKKLPQTTLNSFEEWSGSLPIKEITVCLEKDHIKPTHSPIVEALKIILNLTEYKPTILNELRKWPTLILKLFIGGVASKDMSFLTDCLTAAVRFLTAADVKRLVSEGQVAIGDTKFVGVNFCSKFMKVFLYKFLEKPYILLDESLKGCIIILNDIIKYCMKKRLPDEIYDQVLDLVDVLWPIYDDGTSVHDKVKLLYDMSSFPKKLDVESQPMRWVASQLSSEQTPAEVKTRLVSVLPSGEEFSECYTSFAASCLGSSLAGSDRSEQAALRAALDSLAANNHRGLLRHVACIANTGADRGWWDEAMSSCAASLARCERMELYNDLYAMTWDGLSRGVCDRLMVPLLRYSTPSFCENFFSEKLADLIKIVRTKPREPAANVYYHKCVVDHTKALTILQIACEKVPLQSLESPKSLLYKNIKEIKNLQIFKYLIKTLCKVCNELRKATCPPGADEALQKSFWVYQCAIYKCFSSAICRVQQLEKFSGHLLNQEAWLKIVRPQDTYDLPIIKKRRKTRLPVSIEVPPSGSGVSSLSATARTHMFLRTLSEHPLQYDMFNVEDNQVKVQELQISESAVNHHECAGTLTALVSQAAALQATEWRAELTAAMRGDAGTLLAQIVCNCKEELAPHAVDFRPALLEYIARTPRVENGRTLLNGLHVDILETLIHWREDPDIPNSSVEHLNLTIEYLICTTIVHNDNWFLTLIDKCLELYGHFVSVQWKVFDDHVKDQNLVSAKICLHILKRLTKHKIYMPQLIPTLLKYDFQCWIKELKISEIFGEALAYERERDEAIKTFKQLLKRARQNKQIEGYMKMLYYTQNGYPGVCDEENFRFVTDQTPKLLRPLKNKCIQILAGYVARMETTNECISTMFETLELSELIEHKDNTDVMVLIKNGLHLMDETLIRRVVRQASDCCQHSLPKVRQHAYLLVIKAFEKLFKSKRDEPSTKRSKKMTSDILSAMDTAQPDPYTIAVMSCVGSGAVDSKVTGLLPVVAEVLSTDLKSRLAECLLICVHLTKTVDMSSCVPLLELVFSDLRRKDSYRAAKLRDEPLANVQSLAGPSKLVTRSRTYQGTFSTYKSTRTGRPGPLAEDTTSYNLDVQVTIDSILDTFLHFAKKCPEVSRALTVQVFKAIRESPDRGFDLDAAVAKQLVGMLNTATGITPLLVELARIVVDKQTDGFENVVKNLKELVYGSEGENIVKCLLEDVQIRNIGFDRFVLGTKSFDEDVTMESERRKFALEDLVSCFGRLANWEELTIQQRNNIQSSGLPTVWFGPEEFNARLKNFKVSTQSWFDKMVLTYRNECKRETARWLSETDKWPYRHFDASAIIEAVSWTESGDWPCEIRTKDCLLEWAARLMIRVSRASDTDDNFDSRPFLSHELLWCVRANETELYRPVLECYERNSRMIVDSEKWLHQKLLALRGMGLKRNDSGKLKKALNIAETTTSGTVENTLDTIEIYKLQILLNQDLNTLSTEKLQNIMNKINIINKRDVISSKNKAVLMSMYELAIIYYDTLWTDDRSTQDEVLRNLANTFLRMNDLNLGPSDVHLAVLFNRLEGYSGQLYGNIAKKLLYVFENVFENLDDFSLDHIKSNLHMFPHDLLSKYKMVERLNDDVISKYKQYLDLVRDARFSLLQYCETLKMAAQDNDEKAWGEISQRMMQMMDNPHAGSDYEILIKYKNMLQRILSYNTSNTSTKIEVLTEVIRELKGHDKNSLRISQLCPALTKPNEFEKDGCIERLLSLGRRLKVIKFHEQVSVFLGSIRRPSVFSVLLSDGTSRRYMHKAGEPLRRDAAAVRVARGSLARCPLYTVTPLSEDSGLIEYIEDQLMLRTMITDKYNLDEISSSVRRPEDHELIMSSSTYSFELLCKKLPAYALRSSIEYHSSSLQDFIAKKRRFQDTLAATTILNWMLGLGDRHLENMLYIVADGSVCSVDWGGVFQYGSHELPPARITRNMVAVCDTQVLESRLQQIMVTLRQTHKLLTIFIKMSFKWDIDFENKFQYIQGLLSGSQLSHHVTRSVIELSNKPNKEKYCELLHQVFKKFVVKEQYSVAEQVASLLRHCTDPRILNVTRAGWEPWV